MKKRLLVGRYIDTGSPLHSLDPRAKTAAMAVFMLAVFCIDSFVKAAIGFAFALALMLATRIPLSSYARAVKPLLFILVFTIVFHLAFQTGGVRLIDVGPFAFYTGGLEKGLLSASRMVLFVSFAAMLTFTTPTDRLVQAIGSMLAPLRRIGVPSDRIAMMVGISLRFVPAVFDEAETVWKAQVSRGLELRGKPLTERARLITALLAPVTAGAFRKAIDLADSMEARGYRLGAPRTSLRTLAWGRADTLFLLLFVPLLAATALL